MRILLNFMLIFTLNNAFAISSASYPTSREYLDCQDAKWDKEIPRKLVSSSKTCSTTGEVQRICSGYVYCRSKALPGFVYKRLSTCGEEHCKKGANASECVKDLRYSSKQIFQDDENKIKLLSN